MSELLGHDCDGRPLRAGDRVTVLPHGGSSETTKHLFGESGKVVGGGFIGFHAYVETDIVGADGNPACFVTKVVRRIDDRPELGSWDEVEKITGWNPTKQPVEA